MKEKIKRFFVKENDEEKVEPAVAENQPEDEAKDVKTEEKPFWGYTLGEIKEISKKLGEDGILLDVMSEEFSVFAENRGGSLEEKYAAFVKLKGIMGAKAKKTEEVSDTPSVKEARLHSGFSGASYKDASSGLTKRQMDMAKSAGMSFREYEELLESLPAKVKNKF